MVTGLSAGVLGQRIRQLRTRRGLTQDDLAGGDYSKSYISAIEQGKTRPSLQALQRIASRLEISPGILLDPDAEGFVPYDPEALPRRVRRKRGARGGQGPNDPTRIEYALNMAEVQIYTGQAQQALQAIRELLPSEHLENDKGKARPPEPAQTARIYQLAALAALRAGDPRSGLEYAQQGLDLARNLGDRTGTERLRNLVGYAYYLNDEPLTALEHHRTCAEAIKSGQVRDPNLRLQVFYNLAADYWALHDNERARATYREALESLDEVNSLAGQARINTALASHLGSMHLYALAAPYASRAAGIEEALDNMQLVARMENRYGDILVEMGDLKGAETYLGRSLELAESLNSEVDKALALTNLARFELKQGNLEGANNHAERAVQIIKSTGSSGGKGRGKGTSQTMRAENARVLSKALAVAGEIATQGGDTTRADTMFTEAIDILEGHEAAGGSDIYQRYAQVLAARGDHERASKYYERAYHVATKR
jgi:tetratricopeptide (TPR) repeat protein